MSESARLRRHARARVDRAISETLALLTLNRGSRCAFIRLIEGARARSSLLRPTGDGSQQLLALEALRNLADYHREYLEPPSSWPGGRGSVYPLIHSLASHLLGRYPVPPGFGLVWFGGRSRDEQATRRWFIEHAHGRRFRAIPDLPMRMSRRMERLLLSSPHHLPLRAAMRRAEILALGGEPELVEAVLATRVGQDLEHGEFWRDALHFFINHWTELGPARVQDIIDFLYQVRFDPVELVDDGGRLVARPIEPSFSLARRTPRSLLRMVELWRQNPDLGRGLSWPSVGLPGLLCFDETGCWRMVELLDSAALRFEGRVLRHCVGSYWYNCVRGESSIWSLRRRQDDGRFSPRCTLELDPRTLRIVEVRAYRNRDPSSRMCELIATWAKLAGLSSWARG